MIEPSDPMGPASWERLGGRADIGIDTDIVNNEFWEKNTDLAHNPNPLLWKFGRLRLDSPRDISMRFAPQNQCFFLASKNEAVFASRGL